MITELKTASAQSSHAFPCPLHPILWLKADAGVAAPAGLVAHWNDQSGHPGANQNFHSVSGHEPRVVAGTPGLSFDGSQWLTNGSALTGFDVNNLATGPYTTIVYFKYNGTPKAAPLAQTWNAPATIVGAQTTTGSSGLGIGSASGVQAVYRFFENETPMGHVTGGNLTPNAHHMIAVTDNSAHNGAHVPNYVTLFVDSSTPTAGFPSVPIAAPFVRQISCIGGGATNPAGNFTESGDNFTGHIYEVIVFDHELSRKQIGCIYDYLKSRWN